MWANYIIAGSLDEAVEVLDREKSAARIVAGATDLMLEMERGVRKGISTLVDITNLAQMRSIWKDDHGNIHIGALATHNDVVASEIIRQYAPLLARAAWEVGSPQIRNRGTIAGNLITASPANDTITPLVALNAAVRLLSAQGERLVALQDFYRGVRRTVMMENEIMLEIVFPALTSRQKSAFIKYALRKAQAISVVNIAMVLDFDVDQTITHASVTYGAVAPTIVHVLQTEQFLIGKRLTEEVIGEASRLAASETRPISDVRASAAYRKTMARVICKRGLTAIRDGKENAGLPEHPVLLRTPESASENQSAHFIAGDQPIEATINGRKMIFTSGHHKNLLRLLRDEGLLIGTKEGCTEGECGACTVIMNGSAVMACLVPAPRAHGATIVTVEGVSSGQELHPIQKGFISEGAVQCGYCTPGFIVAGVKFLQEIPNPDEFQIKQAFAGNLCRCTGYYKIVQAVEKAALMGGE